MKVLLNSKDIEAIKSFFVSEMEDSAFEGLDDVQSFENLVELLNSNASAFMDDDLLTAEIIEEVPNIMELIGLVVYVGVVIDEDIDSIYSEDILDGFATTVDKAVYSEDVETLKRFASYSSFDELLRSENFDECDVDFPYTLDDFEILWDKFIDLNNLSKMPGFYKPESFWEKLSNKAKQMLNKILRRKHV